MQMNDITVYNVNINKPFFSQFLSLPDSFKVLERSWYPEFLDQIKKDTLLDIDVTNARVNRTVFENTGNDFPWHDHTGLGSEEAANKQSGTYSGILWLSGNTNTGGSLEVMSDNDITSIDFEVGKFIIIKNNVFHKVSHYYGAIPRVSLIIAFDIL
jgi:hypothetical protein|tara:strand:+ start:173 stop:640 length:468 start_codon:yes stop_codon:yes gene_type:complete